MLSTPRFIRPERVALHSQKAETHDKYWNAAQREPLLYENVLVQEVNRVDRTSQHRL